MILLTFLFSALLNIVMIPVKLALRVTTLGAKIATRSARNNFRQTKLGKSKVTRVAIVNIKIALRAIKLVIKGTMFIFKLLLSLLGSFFTLVVVIILAVTVIIVLAIDMDKVSGTYAPKEVKNSSTLATANIDDWLNIVKAVKEEYAKQQPEYSSLTFISIKYKEKTITARADCTGLVTSALKYYNNKVFTDSVSFSSSSFTDRNNSALLEAGFIYGNFVSMSDLREGDILCNEGHVEIFSSYNKGVTLVYNTGSTKAIKTPGTTISESVYTCYWRPPFTNGTNFTFYLQTDSAYASEYDNGTLYDNGCGATSIAMVLATLTGDLISYTPDKVASNIERHFGVSGNTVNSWRAFPNTFKLYNIGYSCEIHYPSPYNVSDSDFDIIKKTLSDGGYVILSTSGRSNGAKKGIFTSGGHYIVIRKYDNGLYYIGDPNDAKPGGMSFGIDEYRPYNNHGFTQEELSGEFKGYFTIIKN